MEKNLMDIYNALDRLYVGGHQNLQNLTIAMDGIGSLVMAIRNGEITIAEKTPENYNMMPCGSFDDIPECEEAQTYEENIPMEC